MSKEWWGEEGESWKTGSSKKEERMVQYLEWLLTPASLRVPPSKAKLADAMGVTEQTLRNYQKDPWFQRSIVQTGRELARVEKLPDILETLYRQATDELNPRSVAAAKVFIEHIDKVVPGADSGIDVAAMDDEALAKLAVQLLEKVNGGA